MPPEKTWTGFEAHYDTRRPFRTLWRLLRGERLSMGAAGVLFILKHSPVWIMPLLFARIVGILRVPSEHSAGDLITNMAVMAAIVLQNIPSHIAYTWFISQTIRKVEWRLRQALIRRLQHLSMGFHADQSSGRLQSKVLRDVESIQALCQHLIDSGLSGVVGLIVAFSVTLPRDPRTALLYVLLVPIAVVIQRSLRDHVARRNQDFRKAVEDMLARVGEMIAMIPVTRAHGLEEHEVQQVSDRLTTVERAGVRFDVINAIFASTWWAGVHAVQIVFLALLSYRAFTAGVPVVEDVILYWGLFQVVLGSVSLIVNMYPTVARGMEAIRSIGEVLECPDVEQNEGKRRVNAVRGAYRFERVTFAYRSGQATAVRDLSLDVAAGECIAFVGPSGAGKSTVMNLIIGFRRPTSGRILLDGADMNALDLRTYRRFIAVIPQETLLFSASVRDNITYGLPDVPEDRLRQILDAANVTEFLPQLPDGINTLVGERGAKLSGGQRQRVAIARALIRDPRVILLDEATSSLDVVSERYVQEAIDRLVRDRTTFIVAHRLSTIRRAGRIVVLKDGQCVETGTHDELLRLDGEFHRMKLLQE